MVSAAAAVAAVDAAGAGGAAEAAAGAELGAEAAGAARVVADKLTRTPTNKKAPKRLQLPAREAR
jgi:hypothetical protein